MTDSGVLVVKADPTIRIRGNVDWMGTSTPIRTAAIDEAGALVVEFTDNHHDFYEATHVQTRAGVEVYDLLRDESINYAHRLKAAGVDSTIRIVGGPSRWPDAFAEGPRDGSCLCAACHHVSEFFTATAPS